MASRSPVIDDPARGTFFVHRSAFLSTEILDAERRLIFDAGWIYVGHDSEIPRPNDYVTRRVAGRPTLFCRDGDGRVQVLLNTCTHQGTLLCRERAGNTASFQCFSHAWTFDNRGELVGVPGEADYAADWPRAELGLARPPRVEAYRGFWFASYNPGVESLEAYLAGARTYLDIILDSMNGAAQVVRGAQRLGMRANWKLFATNSMDQYHVASTHQSYVQFLKDMRVSEGKNLQVLRGRGMDLGKGHIGIEFEGVHARPGTEWVPLFGEGVREETQANVARLEARYGADRARSMANLNKSILIFPSFIVADMYTFQLRTFYPLAPDHTEITQWSLVPANESPRMRAARLDSYLTFWGPGGFGTPDDVESFVLQQLAFSAGEVEWTDVSKGMHCETAELVAGHTNELQLRAFWRRWRDALGGHVSLPEAQGA